MLPKLLRRRVQDEQLAARSPERCGGTTPQECAHCACVLCAQRHRTTDRMRDTLYARYMCRTAILANESLLKYNRRVVGHRPNNVAIICPSKLLARYWTSTLFKHRLEKPLISMDVRWQTDVEVLGKPPRVASPAASSSRCGDGAPSRCGT
jgi:hypothetical protein